MATDVRQLCCLSKRMSLGLNGIIHFVEACLAVLQKQAHPVGNGLQGMLDHIKLITIQAIFVVLNAFQQLSWPVISVTYATSEIFDTHRARHSESAPDAI